MTNAPSPYYDETLGKWMIDDNGRPREATEQEVEDYLKSAE